MTKQYDLLRLYNREQAKVGDMVTIISSGREYEEEVLAVKEGFLVTWAAGTVEAYGPNVEVFYPPLAWVEDKPVYKGDTLYEKDGNTFCPDLLEGDLLGQKMNEGLPLIYRAIEDLTWTKPLRKVKRQGWVNVYGNPKAPYPRALSEPHPTKEVADVYERPGRLDCVQISWEEVEE